MKKHSSLYTYWAFLIDELPNTLQIISLPAIFGLVLNNVFFSTAIMGIGCFILPYYLFQRSMKLGLTRKRWILYNSIMSVISAIILITIIRLN